MHAATDADRLASGRLQPALVAYPMAHLAVEIYNSMLSIMWPLFERRFGLGYGAIGFLRFVFSGSMTLPQIGFAPLSDRHGSRILAVGGVLVMAAGMSLVGLAPSVAVLALILALAPLGSAAFHPAGTAHMTRSLPRRRGTAVALFMVGGTVGTSLGPVLAAWLYTRHGLPASLWLLPLGLVVAAFMLLLIPADSPRALRRAAGSVRQVRIPAAVLLLMVASMGQSWIEGCVTAYLPLLYTARGLALQRASVVLSLYAALGAVGVLLGGALSDRVPRWSVVVVAEVLTVPFFLGTLLLGGPWALLAPAGLGLVLSLSYPVTVALGQELMPDRLSLASALTMGVSWVIGSLGVALTGLLADRVGMQASLLWVSAVPLAGVACMLALRWRMGARPANA